MSKRRPRRTPTYTTTASAAEAVSVATPAVPTGSDLHHGNHRKLLTHIASAKRREPGSPTAFDKVEFFDGAKGGSKNLHLYIAAASMVAVSFGPESDFTCWNYAAFEVPDEQTAVSLLGGKDPGNVSGCTKRNAIHTRLDSRTDMGLVADFGAAAAFVAAQVDIGASSLPAMSYVGSAKAQNGENQIRARLFAPAQEGSTVAVATTHLREDTTSMVAFHASNTDALAVQIGRGDMTPGGECHSLPEFIDLSMFRAEQSAEAVIGQLLARSLCEFTS